MNSPREGANPGELASSLQELERALDSWPAPWARRAATAWRAQRRRRAVRAPKGFAGVALNNGGSGLELASALTFAVSAGAYEASSVLTERLLEELVTLPCAARAQATIPIIEALLVQGERSRATELARAHLATLALSTAGATLLELLEIGEPCLWLPNGRLNLLACSRRGSWSAAELASALLAKPWLWLVQPELPLLFWGLLQATDTACALRFLNRFLASQGLPRCSMSTGPAAKGNFLGRLRFEALAAAPEGPLVSVLMAVRNAADTIVYAVDSLLAQSYRQVEILVGDDASDDRTRELLRERYGRENRVRLFRSLARQGAYNVRNALARRANGGLLTCHDADDFALPTRLASQVEDLRRPGRVGCITSWLRVTTDGRCVFFKNQKATRLSQVSLMLTRQAFDAVGPYRSAQVGADQELFARLRSHFGERAVGRIASPQLLGLWASGSETRSAGREALEDGYRSPLRRRYSQLVFAQFAPGFRREPSERVDELLRASGNYLEPRALHELI